MFNWLKNKLNPIIPDDAKKGFISSNFLTIKNGSKINVPNNIVCFINYKDKNYLQLNEGEYVLNESTLPELCAKQRNHDKKLKKLKLDLYFVNTNELDITYTYKDRIEINSRLAKVTVKINYNCKVADSKKLFQSILTLEPNPDSITSTIMINHYIEELLINYFLKKDLDSIILSENIKQEIMNKTTKHLQKIGIQLNKFEILLEEKLKKKKIKTSQTTNIGFFDDFNKNILDSKNRDLYNIPQTTNVEKFSQETVDQFVENEYTNSSQENNNTDTTPIPKEENKLDNTFCPRCQNKLIKGSKYCHRCGYEIN